VKISFYKIKKIERLKKIKRGSKMAGKEEKKE
jgi:hypothetical protein